MIQKYVRLQHCVPLVALYLYWCNGEDAGFITGHNMPTYEVRGQFCMFWFLCPM